MTENPRFVEVSSDDPPPEREKHKVQAGQRPAGRPRLGRGGGLPRIRRSTKGCRSQPPSCQSREAAPAPGPRGVGQTPWSAGQQAGQDRQPGRASSCGPSSCPVSGQAFRSATRLAAARDPPSRSHDVEVVCNRRTIAVVKRYLAAHRCISRRWCTGATRRRGTGRPCCGTRVLVSSDRNGGSARNDALSPVCVAGVPCSVRRGTLDLRIPGPGLPYGRGIVGLRYL